MILTIHRHVISRIPRYSVTYDNSNTWLLHVNQAQQEDRGWVICQFWWLKAEKCEKNLLIKLQTFRERINNIFLSSTGTTCVKWTQIQWSVKSVTCKLSVRYFHSHIYTEEQKKNATHKNHVGCNYLLIPRKLKKTKTLLWVRWEKVETTLLSFFCTLPLKDKVFFSWLHDFRVWVCCC